jgi:hypothetical protein
MQHLPPPQSSMRRGRLVAVAALVVLAVAAASCWWALRQADFTGQVERQVKAGVPIGTARNAAEVWVEPTFGVLPTYLPPGSDDRSQGPTLMQRAGVPEVVPGGVVRFTVNRRDLVGRALNYIQPDHVSVFLLLDEAGSIQDYRFLSLKKLGEIERSKQLR